MNKILVTGTNGQLGFELRRALAPLGTVCAHTRETLNLADPAAIVRVLDQVQPRIIVNPAAYTAVDKAESDAATAMAVNAEAPGILAEWAAAHDALLIHYSTDYVFSGEGDRPWREDDTPAPRSVYGQSKWLGEQAVREMTGHHLILRSGWVFGVHGANFLKTILRLAHERDQLTVVADQIGAPTSAALIADVTAQIIASYDRPTEKFEYGTYHLAAQGETSWHAYAQRVVRRAIAQGYPLKLAPEAIKPIASKDYPLPAARPAYSRLDCSKLMRNFGLPLPRWEDGVDLVVDQLYSAQQSALATC
ncbi:dTDP-4-dehydrorhamnose reductase [Crenobacter intestini]|uniref:dTDP-4-dehydrorhamnose reductase n=1 Tax=Crenobacter intestini TaxID=2563443 RepID=A0A4T0UJ00_9NEIS|nr:dTDP-4-dehydrorhamnose reductase [Crenobacter intestini]TIC78502.1 dTDP-4-dehydrorhamnose reductase [Crenobacter intestini]